MGLKDIISNADRYALLAGSIPSLFSKFLQQRFREKGYKITPEQWSILTILWEMEGCNQSSLTELTYRDKPSTTRLLDNLEKDGYVVRKFHPADRRQRLIFLTKKGREIKNEIMEIADKALEVATVNLTDDHIKTIKEAFVIIRGNIEGLVVI